MFFPDRGRSDDHSPRTQAQCRAMSGARDWVVRVGVEPNTVVNKRGRGRIGGQVGSDRSRYFCRAAIHGGGQTRDAVPRNKIPPVRSVEA